MSDPLTKNIPNEGRELFSRLSRVCGGFSREAAMGAALNIIINAIRQSCTTRQSAERTFEELTGRARQALTDHYDANGKRRNVFAIDQHIVMDHFDDRDKIQ